MAREVHGVAEQAVAASLRQAISATEGHFRYESGHHGDLWLDLDPLLLDARRVQVWAAALASMVAAGGQPDIVCGPLTGGAFVAQNVAAELGCGFVFAEHLTAAGAPRYRIPATLRPALRGRTVLVVDDAVNAGSAILSTLADLRDCGAALFGFASLLTLGDAAERISRHYGAPFHTLLTLERQIWPQQECALCEAGIPLLDRPPPAS
jgi:orotate phosphoribosyltransferase